jgi:hypothetical protein
MPSLLLLEHGAFEGSREPTVLGSNLSSDGCSNLPACSCVTARRDSVAAASHHDAQVKLETRIPAGFMSGMSNLIPGVAGLNIEVRTRGVSREGGWLSMSLHYSSSQTLSQTG